VAVARAIELGPEAVQRLKDVGKGYSPQKDAAPRDLPSDALILEVIDALPSDWQWVAGICATYGARPHEALLMAEVQGNGLVVIRGGKTGARQGLPLPKEWFARWELQTKRLPRINLERDHRPVPLGAGFGNGAGIRQPTVDQLQLVGQIVEGHHLDAACLAQGRDGTTHTDPAACIRHHPAPELGMASHRGWSE
jgi:hypothetical protein